MNVCSYLGSLGILDSRFCSVKTRCTKFSDTACLSFNSTLSSSAPRNPTSTIFTSVCSSVISFSWSVSSRVVLESTMNCSNASLGFSWLNSCGVLLELTNASYIDILVKVIIYTPSLSIGIKPKETWVYF